MEPFSDHDKLPEGIFSLLDTDLYKLTMQSAVLRYFPTVEVTYTFTNRTPDMKLNRAAYQWLQTQINRLGNISLSEDELRYLRNTCYFLSEPYLHYMNTFRLRPSEQVIMTFEPEHDDRKDDTGHIELHTKGLWVETILYEIPLLALTSEAYFKFCDRDWDYQGQIENARNKSAKLLRAGCVFSEFGSRRRRNYHTHELVLRGLIEAQNCAIDGYSGKFSGTSNVHFAMKLGVPPIGTVAHEWFMGIAAVTEDYQNANEIALTYWIETFGEGVLGIALTDTFGTPSFLQAFRKLVPTQTDISRGAGTTSATTAVQKSPEQTSTTEPRSRESVNGHYDIYAKTKQSFAEVFTGIRQDSGDPLEFIKTMRAFYDDEKITTKKTIVFSDSLNVERCIEYKRAAEEAGFLPSFGVGTFFTNDFRRLSNGEKSAPLNIVIKLSSANGKPAVKISDNIGKNTGDQATVKQIKRQLGYEEQGWKDGDEKNRWAG